MEALKARVEVLESATNAERKAREAAKKAPKPKPPAKKGGGG